MNLLPTFGIIKEILVFDVENYYIVCELLETINFAHHYHAFEVVYKDTPSFDVSKASKYIEHAVLWMHKQQSRFYVALKYYIVECI